MSRFTVPNVYTQDQPEVSGGTYLVANASGIPAGWVTKRRAMGATILSYRQKQVPECCRPSTSAQ